MQRWLVEISALFWAMPRAINFYQDSKILGAQRAFRVYRWERIAGVRRPAAILLGRSAPGTIGEIDIYGGMPEASGEFNPKVSIIVANYNHASYLSKPLESIYRFCQNIRDYFAACDIGFLPLRFKGESPPLVVIDCLLARKSVLASDIGEIRSMLESHEGSAGELFSFYDWMLDIEAIGKAIVDLENHTSRYQMLCTKVASAVFKFSTTSLMNNYEAVYCASAPSANEQQRIKNNHYESA